MIYAKIRVKHALQLKQLYLLINQMSGIKVVEIKNYLFSGTQTINLFVEYQHSIIAEIIFNFDQKLENYEANSFIYKLVRSEDFI